MPTIHRELCDKWQELRELIFEHQCAVLNAAKRLAENFREYLGAPKTYENLSAERQPAVKLVAYTVDEESGTYTPSDVEHPLKALTRDGDGYYIFGLALAISRHERIAYYLRLRIPCEDVWEIEVINNEARRFEIDPRDDKNAQVVFEHMVGLLRSWVSHKPWEPDLPRKGKIGFELPQARTES